MSKIFLEYPYNFNKIDINKLTPIDIFLTHIRLNIVSNENLADIIFFNKYPIKRADLLNLRKINKLCVIIWITDDLEPINIQQNYKIYRTSLFKSKKKINEYIFPWCSPITFSHDMYSINNKPLDVFFNKLSIGFCGSISSHPIRNKIIKYFEKSLIKTNFIKRHTFIRDFSKLQQHEYRQVDFINNMKNNIFILTPRGTGNWSLRFYESMAYGRIPVLILTDTLLPFENKIDWNNTIIMGKTSQELESKIVNWYYQGEEFIKKKQILCRQIWNDYLSIEGFVKNILI